MFLCGASHRGAHPRARNVEIPFRRSLPMVTRGPSSWVMFFGELRVSGTRMVAGLATAAGVTWPPEPGSVHRDGPSRESPTAAALPLRVVVRRSSWRNPLVSVWSVGTQAHGCRVDAQAGPGWLANVALGVLRTGIPRDAAAVVPHRAALEYRMSNERPCGFDLLPRSAFPALGDTLRCQPVTSNWSRRAEQDVVGAVVHLVCRGTPSHTRSIRPWWSETPLVVCPESRPADEQSVAGHACLEPSSRGRSTKSFRSGRSVLRVGHAALEVK